MVIVNVYEKMASKEGCLAPQDVKIWMYGLRTERGV